MPFDNKNIASSWIWLGEVKDVKKLYQKTDALILVSIYEGGVPSVICEAMIEGCFVIASDICDTELLKAFVISSLEIVIVLSSIATGA